MAVTLLTITVRNKKEDQTENGPSYTLWASGTRVYDDEISFEESQQGALFVGALMAGGILRARSLTKGKVEILEMEMKSNSKNYKVYFKDNKIVSASFVDYMLYAGAILLAGRKGLDDINNNLKCQCNH